MSVNTSGKLKVANPLYRGFMPTGDFHLAVPDETDEKANNVLQSLLHKHELYEPIEESQTREKALRGLNDLVQIWVQKECIKQGYSETQAQDIQAKLFTFGSYRLGVHTSGADIDTLLVGPRNITREMFFNGIEMVLEKCFYLVYRINHYFS